MRFERRQRRVVYSEAQNAYRATPETPGGVFKEGRKPLDPKRALVGISTAVQFWDGVETHKHCLACARTVREAWMAGDRFKLDTDEARKAAELVSDLAETEPDENDICSALVDLMNAIAVVGMGSAKKWEFDVLDICYEAVSNCYATEGFKDWSAKSRRRKFLYEIPRSYRNDVVYTLMGLYFEYGPTPLLTTHQRQELAAFSRGDGPEGARAFFTACLDRMAAYRA